MFTVTGITGKVGATVARSLLSAGQPVRAVVRDRNKGTPWAQLGCEIAVADMSSTDALTAAFEGTAGVFVLLPPVFDPAPGFPEASGFIRSLRAALARAKPEKVVALSTIGADSPQPEPAERSAPDGGVPGQLGRPRDLPARGLVYRKCLRGRRLGEGRCHKELPSAAGPRDPYDLRRRCRSRRRRPPAGALGGKACSRIGGRAARLAE